MSDQQELGKWDQRFLKLAELVSTWSKDPSTQVGAVLVDDKNRILSTGFNGLCRGIPDDEAILNDRETKLKLILHAEENAVAAARGSVAGSTCYVWPLPPCAHCAAVLVQTGVKRVVCGAGSAEQRERWARELELSAWVLREGGVEVVEVALDER